MSEKEMNLVEQMQKLPPEVQEVMAQRLADQLDGAATAIAAIQKESA